MYERVLLVTCTYFPDGEPGAEHLDAALVERGITATWVGWDDPDVDWTDGLAVVRSTWDYSLRLPEFLDWARSVPRLLNGAAVFAWNSDKAYLTSLVDAGLPAVPTQVCAPEDVADAVRRWPAAVVKPRVGAGGRGVVIATDGILPEDYAPQGDQLVQPLLTSVRTVGETSVFVFGGRAVSQFQKLPGSGGILVHEHLGGTNREVPLAPETTAIATRAVEVACDLVERDLDYARVDLMVLDDGSLAVSEVELIEPGLYLDNNPVNAGLFADLVQTVL